MNNKGKRLKAFREYLGYSQKVFAEKFNTAQRNISKYETGLISIPDDLEEKLAAEGMNLHWLATGVGKMILDEKSLVNKTETVSVLKEERIEKSLVNKNDTVSFLNEEDKSLNSLSIQYQKALLEGVNIFQFDRKKGLPTRIKTDEASGESFVFVPVFSQSASAGPGQEETQLLETERSIPVMLSLFGGIHKPVHCGLAKATGDSMIDIGIYGGDLCLFDMDDKKGDGIFMITMYGETRVKRLYYRLAEKKIVIASENQKRYPEPEIIPVEIMESGQLIVHGRIFASFHRMMV
jgi:SOS-response transcriptional repressor LexA/DNA-binding XRE family transcriptional regulator